MRNRRASILIVIASTLAVFARADDVTPPRVDVQLVAATTAVAAGDSVQLGVVLTAPPGWHLYWDGLNDTGFPPSARWQVPDGARVTPLLLPVPVRQISPGDILDHVLEGETVALATLVLPPGLAGPTVAVSCHVEWLVCRDMCVPGRRDLTLTLPVVTAGVSRPESADAPRLAAARRALPRPLPPDGPVRVDRADAVVTISAPGSARLEFFPAADSARPRDLLRDGVSAGDRLRLSLRPTDSARPLRGVLVVHRGDGATATWRLDISGSPADPQPAKETP